MIAHDSGFALLFVLFLTDLIVLFCVENFLLKLVVSRKITVMFGFIQEWCKSTGGYVVAYLLGVWINSMTIQNLI